MASKTKGVKGITYGTGAIDKRGPNANSGVRVPKTPTGYVDQRTYGIPDSARPSGIPKKKKK